MLCSRNKLLTAVIVSNCLLLSLSALADNSNVRGLQRNLPTTPSYEEPQFGRDEKVLPPAPQRQESEELSQQMRFYVKKISLDGNSILGTKQLNAIVANYQERHVTMAELHELRKKLSVMYFEKGYVNSGVLIPNQKIQDGIVHFQIIEGELTEIKISGVENLKETYITKRIRHGITDPLNYGDLQTALRVFEQNALIGKVQGKLLAGKRPGESVLALNIEERSPYDLAISADNHRAPTVGAERLNLTGGYNNISGYGDSVHLTLSTSEGFDSGAITYDVPLNSYDTMLTLSYAKSNIAIVEEIIPNSDIDIEGGSSSLDLLVSHPLYRDGLSTWNVFSGLSTKESDTNWSSGGGGAFDQFAESLSGENKASELQLGTGWIWRHVDQVLALSGIYKYGLDAEANEEIDSNFNIFIGQAQYAMLLPSISGRLLVRSTIQFTGNNLLSLEKIAVGGSQSVRGYRENQLVRDNGAVASVELRMPILKNEQGKALWDLQYAPFVDYGYSANEESSTNFDTKNIYSAGVGLLWDPYKDFHATLYWGKALKELDNEKDGDLQDDGIHFEMSYQVPF